MALGFHYYRRRLARLRLGRLAALTAVAAALTALALAAAQMKPLLTSLATTRVSNAVTQIVTQSVDEAIASGELDYENLVNFEKDNDGKITADQVTSAMLSLTVYGEVPGTEESFPRILGEILPGCPIQIANDSVAGWGGSLAGRPGINIVAGTGSVAYGEDQAGNACRVGGWSLFFADEGSCSWVARQLITEFVKQADGRHPRSAVYEELRREMGLTHDLYFSGYLQTEIRQNSALLAKLQLVALRAAQQGDPAAQDIYRRAAEELTETADAIRRQLDFPAGEPVPVSYSGGLFRAGETIMVPFRACMERAGYTLVQPKYSPVLGALILAARGHLSLAESDAMADRAAAQL